MFNTFKIIYSDISLIAVKQNISTSRCLLVSLSVASLTLVGCGQKGDLYLVDLSSQTVTTSSEVLESTSNPQDAAFADIGDDNYQKTRYLEQNQVLPKPSDDPNDY